MLIIILLNSIILATVVKAEQPLADAGGPYTGLTNQEVYFDGSNSYDPDGDIINYTWDLGDGNTSYEQNHIHTYNTPGIYSITLTVTDNESLNSTDTTTATITNPIIPPIADAGGPYNGIPDQEINFNGSNSYDPDGNIINYTWDLGDGNISYNQNPVHSYNISGIYDVTLTVKDDDGLTSTDTTTVTINIPPIANAGGPYTGVANTAISMSGSTSSDSDGTIVNYHWNFGDGDTATGSTTTHTYSNYGVYTVTLTVTDNLGGTDSDTTTSTINAKPTASIEGPYSGDTNQNIYLDASASYDPDGTIEKYTWDFGDGKTGTGKTIKHIYTKYGTYTITLTVTDDDGLTSTDTTKIYINAPPTANSGGPYYEITEISIQFDGSDSYDIDGTITKYQWTFGDGNTSTLKMPTHTYLKDGSYTVKLTVTDNTGTTDTDTTTATITKKPNHPPNKPTISGTNSSHINTTCNYTIKSSDIDNDMIQYIINWDDQTNKTITPLLNSSTAFNTSHNWSTGGIYTITVQTLDENNATSENQTYKVLIDTYYCSPLGYLIDKNGDTIFDVFYREKTGEETNVEKNNDEYNIDINNDGKWDYTYISSIGQIQTFSAPSTGQNINIPQQDIISITIIIISIILATIIKTGPYLKNKEKTKKKKPKEKTKPKNSKQELEEIEKEIQMLKTNRKNN